MDNDKSPPLFLALRSVHFQAFADGNKTVEWRKWGPRFNDRTLRVGRRVTLAHGYSGARLFGRIVKLEFQPALFVRDDDVMSIYKPGDMLVGIHLKLVTLKPQRPRHA
jgi:hypothetical protein